MSNSSEAIVQSESIALVGKVRVTELDATALRVLARTLVREFKKRGYGLRHTIALAEELLGLACDAIRSDRTPKEA